MFFSDLCELFYFLYHVVNGLAINLAKGDKQYFPKIGTRGFKGFIGDVFFRCRRFQATVYDNQSVNLSPFGRRLPLS
ncbi:MAG: hypothetical protein HQM10_15255 [Candidatus Riflebacteria bacterium]|nr:hypothetical protein [Candidatus Riflebacteria bacterium]